MAASGIQRKREEAEVKMFLPKLNAYLSCSALALGSHSFQSQKVLFSMVSTYGNRL